MCNHPNREAAMVVIADGIWCDPCLVPLVKALNEGGIRTVASCCGHGKNAGSIGLADGRWLVIADEPPSRDQTEDGLAERVRWERAESWDECVEETWATGWLHDFAKSDALARNPYRNQS